MMAPPLPMERGSTIVRNWVKRASMPRAMASVWSVEPFTETMISKSFP